MQDPFSRADADGDSSVSRAEIDAHLSQQATPRVTQKHFDRADRDGDGSVSRDEFEAFMRSAQHYGCSVALWGGWLAWVLFLGIPSYYFVASASLPADNTVCGWLRAASVASSVTSLLQRVCGQFLCLAYAHPPT